MEFHVTCGRHKKLVSVNCLNSLESAICSRFNVRQPLLLQRWHDAYADWLDVEFPIADDNELQANTRLLAIPLTPPPSTSAASAATSFVVSTNNHNSNEALIECDDSLPSDTALSSCLPQQQQQASPPPPLSVSLSLPLSLLPPPPPRRRIR
ncbi:hypothetical protein BOX15_Mlig022576g5 [Macrostomum lignano]|uniref:Uncharacterized protein n=1 Tax=Macrostomum lignano TaxID=282301 RepID=A0A267E4V9_9PLAT|nr:hypothetical protein BOX15_Mlig022576g5 [Macrostomum lignano]